MSTLYLHSARILRDLIEANKSFKKLIYANHIQNTKQIYALVHLTLQHYPVIFELRQALPSQKNPFLVEVMLADLFFGKNKNIEGGGTLKNYIINNKLLLNDRVARITIREGVTKVEDLISQHIKATAIVKPRYARINLLKCSIKEILSQSTSALPPFQQDHHFKDLLIFPPGIDLHAHPLLKDKHLILMDKSSCFTTEALFYNLFLSTSNPSAPLDAIDCCAAPGNKTLHLESKMERLSTIFAFDLSRSRAEIMEKSLKACGSTRTHVIACDFLLVDPDDPRYKDVRLILLDAPCSNSGSGFELDTMLIRQARSVHGHDSLSPDLKELRNLQVNLLLHAMKFPHCERIAYSTCSINPEENENVVASVLEKNSNFKLFNIFPWWKRRGSSMEHPDIPFNFCIRLSPQEDLATGFFVCLFVRKRRKKNKKKLQKLKRQRIL